MQDVHSEEVVISKLDMAHMYNMTGKMVLGSDHAKAEKNFRDAQVILDEVDPKLENMKAVSELYVTYHYLTDQTYLSSLERLNEDTIRFLSICTVLISSLCSCKKYDEGITVGLDALEKVKKITSSLTTSQKKELGTLYQMVGICYYPKDKVTATDYYHQSYDLWQEVWKENPDQKATSDLSTILLNLLAVESDPASRYDFLKEERFLLYKLEIMKKNSKYGNLARGFEKEMKMLDPKRAKTDCRWSWIYLVRRFLIKILVG